MAKQIEDEDIDGKDEGELFDFAERAIEEIKELRAKIDLLDRLFDGLNDVFQKRQYGVETLRAAAFEYVRAQQ